MREILPWKNTHMGLPEGESGHTDTLPSTGADRKTGQYWAWRQTAPPSLGGFHQGSPFRGTELEEEKDVHIPG